MAGLSGLVEAGIVSRDEPLAPLTTYKLGGAAAYFALVDSRRDLEAVADAARADGVPIAVVGRGSNLLVADSGFGGLVVQLGTAFASIAFDGDVVVAGGAAGLPQLARASVKEGRSGLEWCVGVPGSVGGAVAMNAGCFGTETADVLITAELLNLATGEGRNASPSDLEMGYRTSNVGQAEVCVSARFRTEPGDPATGEARIREITRWRKEHQPGGTYNAGSVFKNPPGDAAGRIIDAAGLKGMRVGDVAVSERHANFFTAGPDATAADVHGLIEAVRRRIAADIGVDLEPEIRMLGFGRTS